MTGSGTALDVVNALIEVKGSKDEELQDARHALQRELHEQRKAMTKLELYYESVFLSISLPSPCLNHSLTHSLTISRHSENFSSM